MGIQRPPDGNFIKTYFEDEPSLHAHLEERYVAMGSPSTIRFVVDDEPDNLFNMVLSSGRGGSPMDAHLILANFPVPTRENAFIHALDYDFVSGVSFDFANTLSVFISMLRWASTKNALIVCVIDEMMAPDKQMKGVPLGAKEKYHGTPLILKLFDFIKEFLPELVDRFIAVSYSDSHISNVGIRPKPVLGHNNFYRCFKGPANFYNMITSVERAWLEDRAPKEEK